jgi:hypothetical protein
MKIHPADIGNMGDALGGHAGGRVELTLMQKTANLIELATISLVVARNNMQELPEKDREGIQQLMDESLIEFISDEWLNDE